MKKYFLSLFILLLLAAPLTLGAAQGETVANHGSGASCYTAFLPFVSVSGDAASSVQGELAPPVPSPCGEPPDPLSDDEMIDFNGDGYADLAVGSPGDDSAFIGPIGGINIVYGSASGLTAENNRLINQISLTGIDAQIDEQFGYALAAADYDGDGFTDLAVGVPGENVEETNEVGEVIILFGAEEGLQTSGYQQLGQAVAGVQGNPEPEDRFGESLVGADFNGDGYADLAVGIPDEDIEVGGDFANAGAVTIFYGSDAGLRTDNELVIHQGLANVEGEAEALVQFGTALEAGDFNDDGTADLAVGIPRDFHPSNGDRIGSVMVFYGAEAGLSLAGEDFFQQGFGGVQGAPEVGDRFGQSLAVGDFDNNGVDDLAVGSPTEDVEDVDSAGAVSILYGYVVSDGLSSSGNQIFHQDVAGVLGQPDPFDQFGAALAAADYNGDGADDLAVGVPLESGEADGQGFVQVFYSNGSILSTDGQNLWAQGLVQGAPDFQDFFGSSLGTADFNADGYADLAVGVAFEDHASNTIADAGAVNLIYGSGSGLTAVGNQIWHQDNLAGLVDALDRFGFALTR